MKSFNAIALLVASTFVLAVPAWAVTGNPGTQDSTVTQDTRVNKAADQATGDSRQGDRSKANQSKAGQSKARKHAPTAAMDSATPTEKSANQAGSAKKHPPTGVMDSAVPDQKSPGSNGSQDTESEPSGTETAK